MEEEVLSISGARNSIIPLRRIRGKRGGGVAFRVQHGKGGKVKGKKKKGKNWGGGGGASPITREFHFHISFRLAFYLPSLAIYFIHETANELGGRRRRPPSPLSPRGRAELYSNTRGGGRRGGWGWQGRVNDFHTLSTHVNGIALIP